MIDKLTEYLQDIINTPTYSEYAHELANSILVKWQNGIIPSPKKLNKLSKEIMPPSPCIRIQFDGSCHWLRTFGEGYKLPVPPIGEKAMCCYANNFVKCPGYKKRI